mmetsp:Transcript_8987/g.17113  ORF Transcript_8987/g.17113 Transcript_8987/m.17113 type:complete len:275 (-) Transcript_8987:509-1333(-)
MAEPVVGSGLDRSEAINSFFFFQGAVCVCVVLVFRSAASAAGETKALPRALISFLRTDDMDDVIAEGCRMRFNVVLVLPSRGMSTWRGGRSEERRGGRAMLIGMLASSSFETRGASVFTDPLPEVPDAMDDLPFEYCEDTDARACVLMDERTELRFVVDAVELDALLLSSAELLRVTGLPILMTATGSVARGALRLLPGLRERTCLSFLTFLLGVLSRPATPRAFAGVVGPFDLAEEFVPLSLSESPNKATSFSRSPGRLSLCARVSQSQSSLS